jgi:transposase
VTEDLLGQVAEIYRASLVRGQSPLVVIAEKFDVSHSTAGRWVQEARKAGIMGKANGTRSGEVA